MNNLEYFKERFERVQAEGGSNGLSGFRGAAFDEFKKMGIPGAKHEEWKYTRISSLFNREYAISSNQAADSIGSADLDSLRLPGHEAANELVFINGIFSNQLSNLRSSKLLLMSLEKAASSEHREIVSANLGHSRKYLKDGINALNTAFVSGGVFIHVAKGEAPEHPIYIYNITDAREANVLSMPRSLVHVSEQAQLQIVETYATLGGCESLTNQVMEVVMEKNAVVEYYKIQNDAAHASQVSTTHFRQVGKSFLHTVIISLNGAIVRNNLNVVLEAEHCDSHLYGLYFPVGKMHIDNHTVVDNAMPHSLSNQLYKGILKDESTGVFNGKIFVQQDAQKTNAYQSNKNILLSENASVNTKPQLEIFADDVKCSHGCTVGRLNEEGMFYLRSRGISEKTARALLVHAFAIDILEHIKPAPIRSYVDKLISERLEFDFHD